MGVGKTSLDSALLTPIMRPSRYVALWLPMQEGTGTTVYDKSRYGANGTISGAAWSTGNKAGRSALDFEAGDTDYIEIPASYTQLDFTSEDFSIVSRIKIESLADIVTIFYRGFFGTDGYNMAILSTGNLRFYTHQGASQYSGTAAGAVTTGTWYTFGMSRSGASIRTYINGVDVTTVEGTHIDPASADRAAMIGIHRDKVNDPFDGKMEFLAVFTGIALTTNQHLSIHRRF